MTTTSPAINNTGRRSAVIFDLDGTLVDPAGGITGGIEHALRAMNIPVPDTEVLNSLIGPKLADTLVRVAGVPAGQVQEVIAIYRQWYRDRGMAMSLVYPGLRELLGQLKNDGVVLAVATQKPEPLAKVLLAHHGLADYFLVIRGSHSNESLMPGDDGYRPGKNEIIAAALQDLVAHPNGAQDAVMVGDRSQDVQGARSNGLDCIGVAWGFAGDGELADANVSVVVQNAAELALALATPTASPTASPTAMPTVTPSEKTPSSNTSGKSGKAPHGAV
ncbi:HAD hydrolase-like protein [Arthrobacter sp. E3]|uniref:HAD hydrolase-like protein n=1 Tax=Arthrobacter sp. E3 TaxID=517402 RepID=UPI0032B5557F